MTAIVPILPAGCNSWVIVDRATGEAVLETWSRDVAALVNVDRYEVRTALDHLQRLNVAAHN
jgi:hypothetical protein